MTLPQRFSLYFVFCVIVVLSMFGLSSFYRRALHTQWCMTLAESLEQRGGLFLDSASMLFFRGERSGSGELPEDNSLFADASPSPGSIGFLALLCLTGGVGWLLPHAFSS